MVDAPDAVRCTARLAARPGSKTAERGELQCSLAYDHPHGHIYVSGSYVNDIHHASSGE